MHLRSLGFAILVVLAITVAAWPPPCAVAAEGSWPVQSTEVLLGHGSSYVLAAGARTHSGADVAAEPGEPVCATADGEVTFVGRVPAAGGATVLALTLQCGDVKYTYMPLSSASVAEGDGVGGGDAIGCVAEAGDPSSAETHLHVSARRGTMYVDPVALFGAPVVEAQRPSEDAEGTGGGEAPEAPAASSFAPREAAPVRGATGTSARASAPAPASSSAAPAPGATRVPTAPAAAATPAAQAPVQAPASAPLPSEPVLPSASSAQRAASASGAGRVATLCGIDGMPMVGLSLPGIAECAVGLAAALALRFGLGRSTATRRLAVLKPAMAEDRR